MSSNLAFANDPSDQNSQQEFHRLLQRQIKRHLGQPKALPEEWGAFLQAVSDVYHQFDQDRTRLERSLELSSQELLSANTKLQELLTGLEAQVVERTAELTAANAELEQTLQELHQTQCQLIQTEKMSSLGQLVAGIAHEINNPVNFIHGNLKHAAAYIRDLLEYLKLYQTYYPPSSLELVTKADEIDLEFLVNDLPQVFKSMQTGSDRIRQIVLSLKNFSRMDEAEVKSVDIHDGIESTLMLLQNRLKGNSYRPEIQVIKHYGTLSLIECFAGQLNQVFMNILSNAIDALDERYGLHETLISSQPKVENDVEETTLHPTLKILKQWVQPTLIIQTTKIEDWVEIRMADNGGGIAESHQKRLFDPFFTTKPVGQGTGLGLSISYRVVTEKHRGQLKLCSQLGVGTEFLILIPVRQSKSNL